MSLIKLPPEILSQIVTDEIIDKVGLAGLVRSCKRLHQLYTPLLYHTIKITPTGVYDQRARAFKLKGTFLWKSYVKLEQLLQCLTVEVEEKWWTDLKLESLCEHICRLRVLKVRLLKTNKYSRDTVAFGARFLCKNPMPELKELELDTVKIGIKDMVSFIFLPKLERFILTHLENELWGSKGPVPTRSVGSRSVINFLKLGPSVKPGPVVLAFLRWTENLKALHYDLGDYIGSPRIPSPTLYQILQPLQRTIEELHLSEYHHDDLHAATMDFSRFSSLRTLEITQALLFPTLFDDDGYDTIESNTRTGLYRRLPRSLEYLKIFFDCGSAILDRLFSTNRRIQINEDYDWIEELAAQKEECLPVLSKVHISEHSSCWTQGGLHNPNRIGSWDIPTSVAEIYRKANIELEVLIRMSYTFARFNAEMDEYESDEDEDVEGFEFTPSAKRGSRDNNWGLAARRGLKPRAIW